jgi:hypothetical protein
MKISIFFSVLFFSCASAFSETLVEIDGKNVNFSSPPKLSEVLTKLPDKKHIYWPAASLFQVANKTVQKQAIIDRLKQLKNQQKGQTKKESIEQLIEYLKGWRIANRLPIAINYDLARLLKSQNPTVSSGEYILSTSSRKNYVSVFGAIEATAKTQVKTNSEYNPIELIQLFKLTSMASRKEIIIIQADGSVVNIPITTWNKGLSDVMPGSQIFIPFRSSLFKGDVKSLNKGLVSLAANRVL